MLNFGILKIHKKLIYLWIRFGFCRSFKKMSRLKWTNLWNEDVFIARGHLSDVNLSYHRVFKFWFLVFAWFCKHFSQEWRHENGMREKYEAYHLLTSTFFAFIWGIFNNISDYMGFHEISNIFNAKHFHIKIFHFASPDKKILGHLFLNLSITTNNFTCKLNRKM